MHPKYQEATSLYIMYENSKHLGMNNFSIQYCWAITYSQDSLSNINLAESSTIDFYLGVIYSCINIFNKGWVKILQLNLEIKSLHLFFLRSQTKKGLSEKYIIINLHWIFKYLFMLSRDWLEEITMRKKCSKTSSQLPTKLLSRTKTHTFKQ